MSTVDEKVDSQIGRALNVRDIPPSLRKRFKIWCIQNGKTMNDTLIDFMSAAVGGRMKIKDGEGS